jgi:hypothetical protein
MSKWMPYDGYVGPLGTKLRPIQCIEKNAEEIASRHNADIAALEAERDELQGRIDTACERLESFCAEVDEVEAERDELRRRLNAVLDRLPEGGVWCYACNRATVPIWCENFYEHIPREYKQMKTTFHCPICKRETHAKDPCVDTIRAIVEGRDNG